MPHRLDLEIGGCWNAGVSLGVCGRYSVQLDSDDLYSGPGTLQKIVNLFRKEDCAMVIGSYMVVGPDLREIPPGLVDHSEWTEANGRNNALRINGLGAPRAFLTEAIRNIGFLNTSYGEDYAMVLRILGNSESVGFTKLSIFAGGGKEILMRSSRSRPGIATMLSKTRLER